MNEIEKGQIHGCRTNSLRVISPKTIGKTEDTLIGCMVPIIKTGVKIIIGHFGPGKPELAQETISRSLINEDSPQEVTLYSVKPTCAIWVERQDEYNIYRQRMTNAISRATGIQPGNIKQEQYPVMSEIIVDWSQNEAVVYHRKVSK